MSYAVVASVAAAGVLTIVIASRLRGETKTEFLKAMLNRVLWFLPRND